MKITIVIDKKRDLYVISDYHYQEDNYVLCEKYFRITGELAPKEITTLNKTLGSLDILYKYDVQINREDIEQALRQYYDPSKEPRELEEILTNISLLKESL